MRVEALHIADIFGAKVDDTMLESFIFRLDGQSEKIGRFIDLMKPLGLVEVARTGAVAIGRGKEGVKAAQGLADRARCPASCGNQVV